jgi:hypothetical protein
MPFVFSPPDEPVVDMLDRWETERQTVVGRARPALSPPRPVPIQVFAPVTTISPGKDGDEW